MLTFKNHSTVITLEAQPIGCTTEIHIKTGHHTNHPPMIRPNVSYNASRNTNTIASYSTCETAQKQENPREGENMTEWEKQSGGDIWTPQNIGDEIIGEVVALETGGAYGPQWVLKTSDGRIVKTPSHRVLQNRMGLVKSGDTVRIVAGKKELPKVKGHNETQLYDVYKAKK